MMQVFDRVLATRSPTPCCSSTLIAVAAVLLLAVLEAVRGQVMGRVATWAEHRTAPEAFAAPWRRSCAAAPTGRRRCATSRCAATSSAARRAGPLRRALGAGLPGGDLPAAPGAGPRGLRRRRAAVRARPAQRGRHRAAARQANARRHGRAAAGRGASSATPRRSRRWACCPTSWATGGRRSPRPPRRSPAPRTAPRCCSASTKFLRLAVQVADPRRRRLAGAAAGADGGRHDGGLDRHGPGAGAGGDAGRRLEAARAGAPVLPAAAGLPGPAAPAPARRPPAARAHRPADGRARLLRPARAGGAGAQGVALRAASPARAWPCSAPRRPARRRWRGC